MAADAPALAFASPTQFAHARLGAPPWAPPEPKRGPRHGADGRCWLCGGPTEGVGWPGRTPFGDTFTTVTAARVPASRTVCPACVYLSTGAGTSTRTSHTSRLPRARRQL